MNISLWNAGSCKWIKVCPKSRSKCVSAVDPKLTFIVKKKESPRLGINKSYETVRL
jgi:hypothetical protein